MITFSIIIIIISVIIIFSFVLNHFFGMLISENIGKHFTESNFISASFLAKPYNDLHLMRDSVLPWLRFLYKYYNSKYST